MSPQTPWAIDITYLPNLPGFPAPQLHGPRPIWTDLIQHGLRNIVQVSCQPRAKLCPENCRQENWFSPTQVNVLRTYCILGHLKNFPPKKKWPSHHSECHQLQSRCPANRTKYRSSPTSSPKGKRKTQRSGPGAMA